MTVRLRIWAGGEVIAMEGCLYRNREIPCLQAVPQTAPPGLWMLALAGGGYCA